MCDPTLEAALTTLSESAGRWPRDGGAPLAFEIEGGREGGKRPWTIDDLLLGAAVAGALYGFRSASKPFGTGICGRSSSGVYGAFAMFFKVTMHSISSPAYTVASFQWTNARMFEGAAAAGMVVQVRVRRRQWLQASCVLCPRDGMVTWHSAVFLSLGGGGETGWRPVLVQW